MRVILSTRAVWVASMDVDVTEKVRTVFIMARKSRVEMDICCGGAAVVLGSAKSI